MRLIKTLSTLTLTPLLATLALTLTSSALALGPSSFTEKSEMGPSLTAEQKAPALKAYSAYFLDQLTFLAAAPGLVSEDFSGADVAPGAVVGCGHALSESNACFPSGGINDGLEISTDNGEVVVLGAGLIGNATPAVAADVFASSTTVEFKNLGVYAVGLNLGIDSGSDDVQITVEGYDGSLLGVTTAPVGASLSFWGVISTDAIGKITLYSPKRRGEIIDRIHFGAYTITDPGLDFENGQIDPAWTLAGVGNANQMSAEVVDDGGNMELALTADGATAYLGADNAGFLYKELTGDFRIETDLDTSTMTTGKAWRKAGLMVRASTDTWDQRLLVMQAPVQGRLQFVAREVYGGPGNVKVAYETAAPSALRIAIERVGQVLSVEYSLDGGATWITPSSGLGGSIEMPALPPKLYVGLATVSNNISVTSTALFDNVLIEQPAP